MAEERKVEQEENVEKLSKSQAKQKAYMEKQKKIAETATPEAVEETPKGPKGLSINVEENEEDKKIAHAAKAKEMTALTPKSAAERLGVTGLSGEMATKIGGKAARKEANKNKKQEEEEAKALRERILKTKADREAQLKQKEADAIKEKQGAK